LGTAARIIVEAANVTSNIVGNGCGLADGAAVDSEAGARVVRRARLASPSGLGKPSATGVSGRRQHRARLDCDAASNAAPAWVTKQENGLSRAGVAQMRGCIKSDSMTLWCKIAIWRIDIKSCGAAKTNGRLPRT
jgi:hypothetical protein